MSRRFQLYRETDVTGVSGCGHVADGVEFEDGIVALRWRGGWPTSTVFHDKGIEAVQAIHGHNGATRIVWVDAEDGTPRTAELEAELYRLVDMLHAQRMHPDYEYEMTMGPRKAWEYSDEPPNNKPGWERNKTIDNPEAWERFDYHEESYWRRLDRRPV